MPRGAPNTETGLSRGKIALLVIAILIGVSIGLFILDRMFTRIPTDIQRLGILARTLQSKRPAPEIVVFGNSAIMSGIDTRALTKALPGHPLAWNCASTGQSLIEAYLLTQEVPEDVKTAIYGIFVRSELNPESLHPQKYNTLFMYGYRPDHETIETLERIFGPDVTSMLRKSAIPQIFLSRWALRQLIDTRLRIILRPDLALEKSTSELFHPQRYTDKINPETTSQRISARSRALDSDPPSITPETTQLAVEIARSAADAGRETIFLFPPVHPGLLARHGTEMISAMKSFSSDLEERAPAARIIDAMGLLDATYFIDDNHPTNAGAKILTAYLANALSAKK